MGATRRRVLSAVAKGAVLAAGAGGLWGFWRLKTAADLPVLDDDDVSVSPLVNVQTGKVARATLRGYADAYGTVEAEPARGERPAAGADVGVAVAAVVAAVDCVEGQHVDAGQPLFRLDARAADAAVARAAAGREAAVGAAQSLAGNSGAERDLARLRRDAADAAAELTRVTAERDRLTVRSPIAGTVVGLAVRPGDVTTAGAMAVRIVDLTRLTIATAVPVVQLADVRVGAAAEATVDGKPVAGTVSFVDPGVVDPLTGGGSVDVSGVPGLRLGQVVHVRLVTAEHRDVLAVPAESVVEDEQGAASVRSVERDFRWAIKQPVAAGLRDGGLVEIAGDGVHDGQDVVTVGAFAVPDHARIEVAK